MKAKQVLLGILFLTGGYFITTSYSAPNQDKWIAPKSADNIENPLKGDASTVAVGKKMYRAMCAICHGPKGKGDGMAGTGLKPKPANFTTKEFQSQTDGAIFWKLSEGRSPMAGYKGTLDETKRWQIVNYLRTLGK